MVGLPARGKTHIAQKLGRYISWLGYESKVFNVGEYRRRQTGGGQSHEFFSGDNADGSAQRRQIAMAALDDLEVWFKLRGGVAIYDATNSTKERRKLVLDRCQSLGAHVVFIESICDDQDVIENNIRETKLRSPDYVGFDEEEAVRDFRARIAHYEKAYETIDENVLSFIKLINGGRRVVINNIDGYLPSRVVYFLMNIHTVPRPIWLLRHGESIDNVENRIGGDSELSPFGESFSKNLPGFFKSQHIPSDSCVLWTSTLKRSVQTAKFLDGKKIQWRLLNEIDAGACDGLRYEDMEHDMLEEYRARQAEKFVYRYPNGESYFDLVERLEPMIPELERVRRPLIIISHQAVSRVLYAYLMGKAKEVCPHLSIPLHTLIELRPTAYGYDESRHTLSSDTEGQP
ncbi:MAG: 6-phosphofructo-2-kinase/fructose-2,6-bisphosphatase [Myxococcales bacterium]|nr:MAG: 6-phosphofructo-2-kinase/fructose-2,6-bisphosphatase [Myxococcales bacterium]